MIFQKWFANDTKQFSISYHRKSWKKVGNKPRINFFTNGALKDKKATCLDINLIIGYTIFNYTNFNFRGKKICRN